MASWTYISHDWKTGEPQGLLPLRDVEIVDNLSAGSYGRGILSLDDPKAARSLTAPWLREVTAVRDLDVAGGSVIAMHGPIVARRPSTNGREVEISWASPHAYFAKRVTEGALNYTREQFSIVRGLADIAMSKTGGALPRVAFSQHNSGVTKVYPIGNTERRFITDIWEDLSTDPVTGFDFRWDYTWANLSQRLVTRTLTLGYPTIGRDLSLSRVISVNRDIVDITDPEDGLVARNRYHALGAGTGNARKRAVGNSGSSLNAGYPLLEDVGDHSDVKDQAVLQGIANGAVIAALPGTRLISSTHTISDALPYGAVDLGDKVTVDLRSGVENFKVARRVVTIRTEPETDTVTFEYFDPTQAAS